jgi:hypothetical protein
MGQFSGEGIVGTDHHSNFVAADGHVYQARCLFIGSQGATDCRQIDFSVEQLFNGGVGVAGFRGDRRPWKLRFKALLQRLANRRHAARTGNFDRRAVGNAGREGKRGNGHSCPMEIPRCREGLGGVGEGKQERDRHYWSIFFLQHHNSN